MTGDALRALGYADAQRGHTACPYGTPTACAEWAKGYDQAADEGLAELPRFGKIARKR